VYIATGLIQASMITDEFRIIPPQA